LPAPESGSIFGVRVGVTSEIGLGQEGKCEVLFRVFDAHYPPFIPNGRYTLAELARLTICVVRESVAKSNATMLPPARPDMNIRLEGAGMPARNDVMKFVAAEVRHAVVLAAEKMKCPLKDVPSACENSIFNISRDVADVVIAEYIATKRKLRHSAAAELERLLKQVDSLKANWDLEVGPDGIFCREEQPTERRGGADDQEPHPGVG
jgi:hypothetical protein